MGHFAAIAHRFRDSIRARRVIGGGHHHLGAELLGSFTNALVVGGDQNEIKFFTVIHTLEDVL